MTTVEWELIGILITLVVGFAGLFFKLGRRDEQITTLQKDLTSLTGEVKAHDEYCHRREKQTNERLEEGSRKMALLQQGQLHIRETVDDIKKMLNAERK